MKFPISLTILFLLLITASQPAFPQWTWQNPLPTGNTYRGCDFIDSHTGWIVGSIGCILKTSDGGSTWDLQNSGVTSDLYAVYFLDENYGWAVGNGATILHTKNGGDDWIIQQGGPGSSSYITSVYFADSLHGWTDGVNGGGQYYETADGGNTWLMNSIPGVSYAWEISSMFFMDPFFFWALTGVDQISHTEDGGNTWITGSAPTGWGDIFFVNNDTGWVTDSYRIYRTTDRAQTWEEQVPMQGPLISGLYFTDAMHGWACGNGSLLKTSDCGENWLSYDTEISCNDIHFIDALNGWAVGGWVGELYKTTDGGISWEDKRVGPDGYISEISFGDDQFGLAIHSSSLNGERSFLITNNAGMTWTQQTIIDETVIWNGVWLQDASHGWICGRDGTIAFTENSGQNWAIQRENRPDERLFDIQFLNTTEGFAAGVDTAYHNVLLLKTVDGGLTWNLLHYHYAAYFWGMWFTDSSNGYMVVVDRSVSMPVLMITRNGGESWELRDLPLSADEEAPAIHFIDAETGFIAADNCILRTTNSGETWERIEKEGNFFNSIWFSDSLNGWCVGEDYYDGVACRTTDGGNTWENIPLITGSSLRDVFFTAPENGWVCGERGTILKWGDPGPVSIGDENPGGSSPILLYPNPASDILNIDLSYFPIDAYVTYRIYTIDGRLIGSGSYRKTDAGCRLTYGLDGFRNGIYLIQLASEGVNSAERFVIIK